MTRPYLTQTDLNSDPTMCTSFLPLVIEPQQHTTQEYYYWHNVDEGFTKE